MLKGRGLFRPYTARNPAPEDSPANDAGLLLQRTRMSADRAFVSMMQSSMALIVAGFVIGRAFGREKPGAVRAGGEVTADLGLALSVIGVWMLVVGIAHHLVLIRDVQRMRRILRETGMIDDQPSSSSTALTTAVLLLVLGLLSVVSLAFAQTLIS